MLIDEIEGIIIEVKEIKALKSLKYFLNEN